MSVKATGRLDRSDGADVVVFERRFAAPVDDVWAAVTESDRLARWIGTWTGDPAVGSVEFTMNAEGEGAAATTYEIRACEPPRRLAVHAEDEFGVWDLVVELTPEGAGTLLVLRQRLADPATLDSTGPGWDYYLDRLVAAETGADPAAVDWDRDYYPALQEHYRQIAAAMAAR
jgi:uncharacterized protein YndB with AHSA1/START domain